MSLFCKPKKIDYSQRQFITRKAISPSIRSSINSSSQKAPLLVLGVPNEIIQRTRHYSKVSNTYVTSFDMKDQNENIKRTYLKSERKSIPSENNKIDPESSELGYSQKQHYKNKICQLTQLLHRKDVQISKLKQELSEYKKKSSKCSYCTKATSSNNVSKFVRPVTAIFSKRSSSVILEECGYTGNTQNKFLTTIFKKIGSMGNLNTYKSMDSTILSPQNSENKIKIIKEAIDKNLGKSPKKLNTIKIELDKIKQKINMKLNKAQNVIAELVRIIKIHIPSYNIEKYIET